MHISKADFLIKKNLKRVLEYILFKHKQICVLVRIYLCAYLLSVYMRMCLYVSNFMFICIVPLKIHVMRTCYDCGYFSTTMECSQTLLKYDRSQLQLIFRTINVLISFNVLIGNYTYTFLNRLNIYLLIIMFSFSNSDAHVTQPDKEYSLQVVYLSSGFV